MKKLLWLFFVLSVLGVGIRVEAQEGWFVASQEMNLHQVVEEHRMVLLSPGRYLLSEPLEIPRNTVVMGSGKGSVLELMDGDACVVFHENSGDVLLDNIAFMWGGVSAVPMMGNEELYNGKGGGSRYGISVEGDVQDVHIRNCYFSGFDKAGISLYRTHNFDRKDKYCRTFKITDCVFEYNFVGLLLDVRAEYHQATGCSFSYNRIGAFVEGGNNYFSNCHFNANSVGCVVSGQRGENDSHGTIVGSSFNHNTGYAIVVSEAHNGFHFVGCQIFDGKGIRIERSKGIFFTGGTIACRIEVEGKESRVMLNDNYFTGTYGSGEVIGEKKCVVIHPRIKK